MLRRARSLVAACLISLSCLPAGAQDGNPPQSPILTIDSERVFGSSDIGQKIAQGLEAELEALVTENRTIEADLTAEERALTDKRAGMDPAEFRALADAFDEKVQRIRAEQDAKERALQTRRESERQGFIDIIAPILTNIGRERGAIVILERRGVILSADSADVTDEVIERVNAALAEPGTAEPAPPEEPTAEPEPDVDGN